MSKNFPHINDTSFPDLETVNTYKYENTYDYEKYTDSIKIKMLNVNWCGDYDNVVYFDTKAARDKWFDNQVNSQNSPVREMTTMFRLYSRGTIKVDLPIDEAMRYNYVMIDYGKLPNQTTKSNNSRMYYFIENLEQSSVNATELTLNVDFWTTYIYDMGTTYVNLMRGHAPMVATNVANYLSNPIENSEYLLTPDVNYGELQRVGSTKQTIINDSNDLFLCFATNGDVDGSWGNTTKTRAMYNSQALSNVQVIGCDLGSWSTFRSNVESQLPQFLQTVKAMFIVPKKLLNTGSSFTLCGVTFYHFNPKTNKKLDNYTFTKAAFGYDSKYANIAKLYTYPYAVLEVNDFNGNTIQVKVEECGSELGMYVVTNLMYPFLNTESYLTGVGGGSVANLNFFQSTGNTFTIGGRDYSFKTTWNIPTFGVQLTADNDWTLNGKIGADAGKANSTDSANSAFYNTLDGAVVGINGGNLNRLYNLKNASAAIDNVERNYQFSAEQSYLSLVGNNVTQTHALEVENAVKMASFGNTLSSGGLTTAAGFATGGPAGAAGAAGSVALNAATNYMNFNTSVWGSSTGAQLTNRDNLEYYRRLYGDNNISAQIATNLDGWSVSAIDEFNANSSDQQQGLNARMTYENKEYSKYVAQNVVNDQSYYQGLNSYHSTVGGEIYTGESGDWDDHNSSPSVATTVCGSAYRSYYTSVGGTELKGENKHSWAGTINRSYNASHNQKLLSNHPEFGSGGGNVDKPIGLRYTVVTQSKNAIRQAAEQFLRYGYMLNMEWKITTFNLMSKFTYWQCDVMYCNDKGVYEGAQSAIKDILNNGTTVWRNPDEIGMISIYSNEVA